ncbi:MAG: imidazole glycerol phosphate synthase subunit HisH [Candidatus Bathyarchaeia archaeon]
MVRIAIVDYGIGNLRSIRRSLEEVGSEVIITHRKKEMIEADAIVLPGVGAFEGAVKNLEPISGVLLDQVQEGKPLLGICLGLQLLFTASTEGGYHRGLDVFRGRTVRLPSGVKVPHMGWNTLKVLRPDNPLLKDVPDGAYVYFVHSYYADAEHAEDVISKTYYGLEFASALSRGAVFATQFHPEKSGETGLKILKNFVEFVRS